MDEPFLMTGIVLAAGRSARMGRPKALLPCGPGGETFAARIVGALRAGGVDRVLVVGRPDDEALRAHVGRLEARYVINPDPERGQLSSLVAGLDEAEARGATSVIATPVDMPQVRPATVAALLAAWRRSPALILRPAHAGAHGHPVIFRREVFADLRAADPRAGAKVVLRRHADRVLDLDVDDPGVLRDVDAPDDYARMFGPLP